MDYIRFVDIENKRIYNLGKRREAKHYLPFMAYKFRGKPAIFFGDETHCFLDDKYETKEYGGDYEDYSLVNEDWNTHILTDIEMSKAEFDEIYEKIGGQVVNNLEDYIRYKYKPR